MPPPPVNETRLLLADDHRLVRAGFRSLLEQIPTVEVVAEADNGREALELAKKHRPDIALIDIAMPNLNGLETLARIKKQMPTIKVIILSMHADEQYVIRALRANASGYLIKDAPISELELAIRAVARGETYLSPRVSTRVIQDYVGRIEKNGSPLNELTSRQREIVQLIAEGNSTKEIAFQLNVSVKTVEAHRKQLMDKLHIDNIPDLVRYAMRTGLVPPVRNAN